jgi:hypothetical protein
MITMKPLYPNRCLEDPMKRILALFLLVLSMASLVTTAEAARVRVVHRGPRRTTVVVHRGFPLRRPLPHVVIRAPRVAVRVTPRLFLPSVVFGAAVVAALPGPDVIVWHDSEVLNRDEEWTEFTLNVDQRGTGLLLDISKGSAQISFAEVVFENGDAQVVDFNDKVHREGIYNLLDFKDGRKVDHVRIVAKADGPSTQISVHMLK